MMMQFKLILIAFNAQPVVVTDKATTLNFEVTAK